MVCTVSCLNTMHIRALTCLPNLTRGLLFWPPKLKLYRIVFLEIKTLLKWTNPQKSNFHFIVNKSLYKVHMLHYTLLTQLQNVETEKPNGMLVYTLL